MWLVNRDAAEWTGHGHGPAFADIAAAKAADHKLRGFTGRGGQERPDRALGLEVESEPLNTQELVWEHVPRKPHHPQEMPFSREMQTVQMFITVAVG